MSKLCEHKWHTDNLGSPCPWCENAKLVRKLDSSKEQIQLLGIGLTRAQSRLDAIRGLLEKRLEWPKGRPQEAMDAAVLILEEVYRLAGACAVEKQNPPVEYAEGDGPVKQALREPPAPLGAPDGVGRDCLADKMTELEGKLARARWEYEGVAAQLEKLQAAHDETVRRLGAIQSTGAEILDDHQDNDSFDAGVRYAIGTLLAELAEERQPK